MNPWDRKVQQFEFFLEQHLSKHNADGDATRDNIRKHAEDAAAVQARLLLEFALCNPVLASIPEQVKDDEFSTVFDIITRNVIDSLVDIGNSYLDSVEK
jgi:hypothetical protein